MIGVKCCDWRFRLVKAVRSEGEVDFSGRKASRGKGGCLVKA